MSERFSGKQAMEAAIARFQDAKLPVFVADDGKSEVAQWAGQFSSWVDTLDRF
jgi:hypothetical protein